MFVSIFQNLCDGLSGLLDALITAFLSALNLDLSAYLVMFPILNNIFTILQSIAIGLVAVLAGMSLATFWLGSVDQGQIQDRPVNILLRSFIAAIGIYFGGYILTFVTKMATVPFDTFNSIQASTQISEGITKGAAGLAKDSGGVISELALAILNFLLIVLISINLFKLTVEVCERYMMVGVLVFTSPIVYPTISTKQTSRIFKSWWGMFIGALIMMSMSVLFLKLIVNGLANMSHSTTGGTQTSGEFFVRMIIILATCKIAQRVDTYLQQLGLSVATTGGSMVDEMIGVASAMGNMFNRARSSHESTLGANRDSASLGARTSIGRGIKKAQSDHAAGASVKESFKAGAYAAKENFMKNTTVGNAISSAKQAKASGASKAGVAAAGLKGAAVGTARQAYNFVAPGKMATHDGLKTGAQEKAAAEAAKRAAGKGTAGGTNPAGAKPGDTAKTGADGKKPDAAAAGNVAKATAAAAVAGAVVDDGSTDTANGAAAGAAGSAAVAAESNAHDSSVRNHGDEPVSKSTAEKVEGNMEIKPEEAKQNLENHGVTDDGNAFVVDKSEGDDSSLGLPVAAVAAGAAIDAAENGEYVTGSPEAVGAWLNAASEQANSIPEGVGDSRLTDESIPAEDRAGMKERDRSDFAKSANDMVSNTINSAPPAAIEAALDGKSALSGNAAMADATPKAIAPIAEGESADSYEARYMAQSKADAATFDSLSANRSGSEHSFAMAQKYFGQALPEGATMTAYKATNVPAAGGNGGSAVARSHQITYTDGAGASHTMELLTSNAVSGSGKSSGDYGTYQSASGATYYSKDISGSRQDNGSGWSRPEQTPVNIPAPSYVDNSSQAGTPTTPPPVIPRNDAANGSYVDNTPSYSNNASSGAEYIAPQPSVPIYDERPEPVREPVREPIRDSFREPVDNSSYAQSYTSRPDPVPEVSYKEPVREPTYDSARPTYSEAVDRGVGGNGRAADYVPNTPAYEPQREPIRQDNSPAYTDHRVETRNDYSAGSEQEPIREHIQEPLNNPATRETVRETTVERTVVHETVQQETSRAGSGGYRSEDVVRDRPLNNTSVDRELDNSMPSSNAPQQPVSHRSGTERTVPPQKKKRKNN